MVGCTEVIGGSRLSAMGYAMRADGACRTPMFAYMRWPGVWREETDAGRWVQARSAVRVADVIMPRYVDCQERYQHVQHALGRLKLRGSFVAQCMEAEFGNGGVVNIIR